VVGTGGIKTKRSVPPISVVLAAIIMWVSFAWGLPADALATEGEADVAAEDPWAGVRISDAYDDLRCPYCWGYNELTAARCPSCGHEFLLPSGEYTYPPWVFVPGKGYYREGTLLEAGRTGKGLKNAGLVLIPVGFIVFVTYPNTGSLLGAYAAFYGGLGAMAVGGVLLVIGLGSQKEPVYAFASGERYEPYERPAFTRRPVDTDGAGFKIEVTLVGF
jgi:DNA-directed RNA polymerase subunit RPC12/RpoP